MEHTLSASTEDLDQITAAFHGPITTLNDSGFATRHTVIVEVVEGLDFEGDDRRYYVKLSLEHAQWHTSPSLKSHNPAWREYFIGEFVGTKLESPSIGIRVKYRGRARAHHFASCKIPLLSVSGSDSLDRWFDLYPAKSSSSSPRNPKLRLRLTCRKAYDKKSEVEVEVQLINSIVSQEREVVARNTQRIAELTGGGVGSEKKVKDKHKVQKLLREITHANKKIRQLQTKKQGLLAKARERKILLSPSEANFCVPTNQTLKREELHERLLTIRAKLRREHEAFEFHKRYSGEVEGDDKEDWTQNTDELKRRLVYLKNRERTYLMLLQDATRREIMQDGGGGRSRGADSDDHPVTVSTDDDEWLEVALGAALQQQDASPMDKMKVLRIRRTNTTNNNNNNHNNGGAVVGEAMLLPGAPTVEYHGKRRPSAIALSEAAAATPFPGVPFHQQWESPAGLKADVVLVQGGGDCSSDDDDDGFP